MILVFHVSSFLHSSESSSFNLAQAHTTHQLYFLIFPLTIIALLLLLNWSEVIIYILAVYCSWNNGFLPIFVLFNNNFPSHMQ